MGIWHVRYADDIMIFTKNKRTVQRQYEMFCNFKENLNSK